MKTIRPIVKREIQTERSAMFKYIGARSAMIESRSIGALKLASDENVLFIFVLILLTALMSSRIIPWIGLAWTEDGLPAGGIVIAADAGATFLVFSFSFSSFVTDLLHSTKKYNSIGYQNYIYILNARKNEQLRENPCEVIVILWFYKILHI